MKKNKKTGRFKSLQCRVCIFAFDWKKQNTKNINREMQGTQSTPRSAATQRGMTAHLWMAATMQEKLEKQEKMKKQKTKKNLTNGL